jgi:hypothetical protein
MRRQPSSRVKFNQNRLAQKQAAAPGIPSAFADLLFAQPALLPLDLSAANGVVPQLADHPEDSDELSSGHPMWRWNRGKYDRTLARQRREQARSLRATAVNSAMFVSSTLALTVVFVAMGIH